MDKYEQLRKDMEEFNKGVHKDLSILNDKVDKIIEALKGNSAYGNEGLVQRVKRNEKWIEKQRYLWAKIYGGIAVSSGLAVWLMKLIKVI